MLFLACPTGLLFRPMTGLATSRHWFVPAYIHYIALECPFGQGLQEAVEARWRCHVRMHTPRADVLLRKWPWRSRHSLGAWYTCEVFLCSWMNSEEPMPPKPKKREHRLRFHFDHESLLYFMMDLRRPCFSLGTCLLKGMLAILRSRSPLGHRRNGTELLDMWEPHAMWIL